MKKVVVLGALGMAGHVMAEYLDQTGDYEVFGIARDEGHYVTHLLDVLDFKKLESTLMDIQPDIVINCIGVLVSKAHNDISTAILINSYLPHLLAEFGAKITFKLVHISTDCVFSGKDGQYSEKSFKDGDDNYARTKALGEIENDKDLTIRTSIIGPELKINGTGLLDWFFKQSNTIKGYTKAYWSGVTTLELAKATHQMIRQNISGLYQLCPKDKISKYELLKLFAQYWNKEIEILPYNDYKVDKSLVCTRNDFSYPAPTYDSMMQEMRQWMYTYSQYYCHYQI